MMLDSFFTWTSRIIRVCLYGLMLSIPIGNAPVEIFSNIAMGLFLIECLIWFFLFITSSPRKIQMPLLRKYFFITLLCYVVWNVVSVFFSVNVSQSAEAIYKKLLEGVLLFFCCMFHIRKKEHLLTLFNCLFFSAVVASLNGLAQWFTGKDFIRGSAALIEHDGRRVSGAFKHPNGFACYLSAVLVVTISLLFSGKQYVREKSSQWWKQVVGFFSCRSRLYLAILFILGAVVFGLTFSRGGWLGFVCGLLFLGQRKKKILISSLIVMMVFLAIFTPMLLHNRWDSFSGLSSSHLLKCHIFSKSFWETIIDGISTGREVFWRDAFHMAMEHPFVGSGLNTYTQFLDMHQETFKGFYAHNCYLQMAVEIGFVGVFFFIALLLLFFHVFLKNVRSIKDPFFSAAAWGMAAATLAVCVHAFFDTTMYAVQLAGIHWVLMGLVMAIFRMEHVEI